MSKAAANAPEPETDPGPSHSRTPEVVELQQKVTELEKQLQRAVRAAAESEIARQSAEAQLECKLFILDGSNDELAQDLQKRLSDLSAQLEDARRRQDEAKGVNDVLKQENAALKKQLSIAAGTEKEFEMEKSKCSLEKNALSRELADLRSKLAQTESALTNELNEARKTAEDAMSNEDELTRENYLLKEELEETKEAAVETSRKIIELERKNYAQILEIAELRTVCSSTPQEVFEMRQRMVKWEEVTEQACHTAREAELRAQRAENLLVSNQGIFDAALMENESLKRLIGVIQQTSSRLDEASNGEYDVFHQNRISAQNFSELIRVKDALENEVADLKRTIVFGANANQQLQESVNFLTHQLEAERNRASGEYNGEAANMIGNDQMTKLLAEYDVWKQQRQQQQLAASKVQPAAAAAAASPSKASGAARSDVAPKKKKMELEEGEIVD